MTKQRTVTFRVEEGFFQNYNWNEKELTNAVGYLCKWGIQSPRYMNVFLWFSATTGNVSANYMDSENNMTYHMLAMRGEDGNYSFHS